METDRERGEKGKEEERKEGSSGPDRPDIAKVTALQFYWIEVINMSLIYRHCIYKHGIKQRTHCSVLKSFKGAVCHFEKLSRPVITVLIGRRCSLFELFFFFSYSDFGFHFFPKIFQRVGHWFKQRVVFVTILIPFTGSENDKAHL